MSTNVQLNYWLENNPRYQFKSRTREGISCQNPHPNFVCKYFDKKTSTTLTEEKMVQIMEKSISFGHAREIDTSQLYSELKELRIQLMGTEERHSIEMKKLIDQNTQIREQNNQAEERHSIEIKQLREQNSRILELLEKQSQNQLPH